MELLIRKLRPEARLPARATEGATGFDLLRVPRRAAAARRGAAMVPTGVAIEFPRGFDAQVRPRSGLSAKGVGVAFGTVDADYRGELLVTMWTFGDTETYELRHHDRIAQLVVRSRWRRLRCGRWPSCHRRLGAMAATARPGGDDFLTA